jgi:hypothetical protein
MLEGGVALVPPDDLEAITVGSAPGQDRLRGEWRLALGVERREGDDIDVAVGDLEVARMTRARAQRDARLDHPLGEKLLAIVEHRTIRMQAQERAAGLLVLLREERIDPAIAKRVRIEPALGEEGGHREPLALGRQRGGGRGHDRLRSALTISGLDT